MILKILGAVLAIYLCFYATIRLFTSADWITAIFNGCIFIILGTIAGLIFGRIINPLAAAYIGKIIFWSSDNISPPPPEFSMIRAKIAKGEYEEAEKELRELLAKDNGNPYIVELLAELFIDKLCDFRKAEGLLKAYLSKKERNPNDIKFAMMLVDIYIENGQNKLALEFLKGELLKNYDKSSLKSLKRRISAMENKN